MPNGFDVLVDWQFTRNCTQVRRTGSHTLYWSHAEHNQPLPNVNMQQQTTSKGSLARTDAKLSSKHKTADITMNVIMVDVIAIHLDTFHATE